MSAKKIFELKCWRVCIIPRNDFLRLPELSSIQLAGAVYGHSRYEDGHRISTSPIREVDGRRVVTQSGSTYLLGDPDPRYLTWLEEQGVAFDPENPIKVRE